MWKWASATGNTVFDPDPDPDRVRVRVRVGVGVRVRGEILQAYEAAR